MIDLTLNKLSNLYHATTPGVWGPTTAGPVDGYGKRLAKGERGPGTWGAVVADSDGRGPGIDHQRYADGKRYPDFEEEGADYYGGTLVGESMRDGNGEFIAEVHNAFPGMLETIRDLRAMLLWMGLDESYVDQMIAQSMKGEDPVDPA